MFHCYNFNSNISDLHTKKDQKYKKQIDSNLD